jgi:hypothetical protein
MRCSSRLILKKILVAIFINYVLLPRQIKAELGSEVPQLGFWQCWNPDPDLEPDPEPNPEPNPDPLVRGTDPGIRIRIRTKMSRIPNSGF